MTDQGSHVSAGWYYAPGDPRGTTRYWDGRTWTASVSAAAGAPMAAGTDGTIDLRSEDQATVDENETGRPSPWKRTVGRIIDIGAYASPGSALMLGLAMLVSLPGFEVVATLVSVASALWFEYLFLTRTGTTPGKLLFGLAVVDGSTSPPGSQLSPVSRSAAAKRALVDFLHAAPSVALFWTVLGFVGPVVLALSVLLWLIRTVLLFVGKGLTVSDRLAGTAVVEADHQMATKWADSTRVPG